MDEPYDLGRYLEAQNGVYEQVREELLSGQKRSHWMWFIFPQLKGLGSSSTARFYAIGSLAEARAFLAHPLLGVRLRECTRLVNDVRGRTLQEIFGYPDHLKFRSCMTLFERAAGSAQADAVFRTALDQYCGGEGDPRTLELLTSASGT